MESRFIPLNKFYGQHPVYATAFDFDKYEDGLQANSFVSTPAMESGVVFMNDSKQPVKFVADDLEQIIYGALLIPDKPIYRIDPETGQEYYLVFSAEQIRRLRDKFMMEKKTDITTLEHAKNLQGNYLAETWIKKGQVKDKSLEIGLPDEPINTLFAGYKVQDKELFLKMKSGEIPVNGFSIEAFLGKIKIQNTMTEKNKKEKSFFSWIWNGLKSDFKEDFNTHFNLEMENIKLKDVTTTDSKTMNIDSTTKVATINGQPVSDGDHTLTDGTVVTTKDSIVIDSKELITQSKQNTMTPEQLKEITDQIKALTTSQTELKKAFDEIQTKNTELKTEAEKLKSEAETLKGDLEKLSKTPAVPAINTIPNQMEQVDFSKMNRRERFAYNLKQMQIQKN